jgi:hypothetical protein
VKIPFAAHTRARSPVFSEDMTNHKLALVMLSSKIEVTLLQAAGQ